MNPRPLLRTLVAGVVAACAAATALPAADAAPRKKERAKARQAAAAQPVPRVRDGEAEARLLEVYRLIGQGEVRVALQRVEALVQQHPNFQLAQLVHGDLLAAQVRPLRGIGDVEAPGSGQLLAELREESAQRIRSLRERPPPGTVPAQFVQLSPRSRHAIAVDASKSRLYLFENTASGLKLLADYYISVGKLGIEKAAEGDLRTPLGVYYVTSNLDPKTLKEFYGVGALPINYPNPYDLRRGKTGGGIWLHGTPPAQFSRAPKATDGCVVLANPDLERIIRTVEVRTTPVVIAPSLQWVAPQSLQAGSRSFTDALAGWRSAKAGGDVQRLLGFYAPDAVAGGKPLADALPQLRAEALQARGKDLQLKDLSYLHWTDAAETMVVTFGEVPSGVRAGPVKRQYWMRMGSQWKIFYEGVIG